MIDKIQSNCFRSLKDVLDFILIHCIIPKYDSNKVIHVNSNVNLTIRTEKISEDTNL